VPAFICAICGSSACAASEEEPNSRHPEVDPLDNRLLVYDRTESVEPDIHAIENF
jgi:hypothetical protein